MQEVSTQNSLMPNLHSKIIPTKIRWLKTSGKFPLGLGIPPLKTKILLESDPLKSRIVVRRLAVLCEHYPRDPDPEIRQKEATGDNLFHICCWYSNIICLWVWNSFIVFMMRTGNLILCIIAHGSIVWYSKLYNITPHYDDCYSS